MEALQWVVDSARSVGSAAAVCSDAQSIKLAVACFTSTVPGSVAEPTLAETVQEAATSVMAMLPAGPGWILAGPALGAAAVSLAGVAAGAVVPSAMAYFGTVVKGVGTIHTAGGVAASLQWAAATFTSMGAVATGGMVGGAAVTVAVVMDRVTLWFRE